MTAHVRVGSEWRLVQGIWRYNGVGWDEVEEVFARDGGPSAGTDRLVYQKSNPLTKQWYPSWSQSYREGGSPAEAQPNQLHYGDWGTYDQLHDARSLIGWPVTSVRDFLQERRKVLSVRLRLQINAVWNTNPNNGITAMRIGGHDSVNQPGNFPDGDPNWVYAFPDAEAYNGPGFLKGDPVWIDLPTTFGDDLRTGTIFGFILYYGQDQPAGTEEAVYFFGDDATAVRRPVLEITADYLD